MSTWKILDEDFDKAKIMALGVGGCGGNIISNIADSGANGIELVSINTDSQEQNIIHKSKKIKIGNGHGAGNNPEFANKIAQDSKDLITKVFDEKPEVLFLVAGMGGGTGTGATPVIARIAKELDILTIALVTTPFESEGDRKSDQAQQGIDSLINCVDCLIEIPNQKIYELSREKIGNTAAAYKLLNDEIKNIIEEISNMLLHPNKKNIDFSDLKSVIKGNGYAIVGLGSSCGQNRTKNAIEKALTNPFFNQRDIRNAKGVIFFMRGNNDFSFNEFEEGRSAAKNLAEGNAQFINGFSTDETMGENISVMFIAAGLRRRRGSYIDQKVHIAIDNIGKLDEETGEFVNIDGMSKIDVKRFLKGAKN
ncbi:cell division FtsZ family protein [bacterium]|nr:cell division FtsZ family protein [bacterium]